MSDSFDMVAELERRYPRMVGEKRLAAILRDRSVSGDAEKV